MELLDGFGYEYIKLGTYTSRHWYCRAIALTVTNMANMYTGVDDERNRRRHYHFRSVFSKLGDAPAHLRRVAEY